MGQYSRPEELYKESMGSRFRTTQRLILEITQPNGAPYAYGCRY